MSTRCGKRAVELFKTTNDGMVLRAMIMVRHEEDEVGEEEDKKKMKMKMKKDVSLRGVAISRHTSLSKLHSANVVTTVTPAVTY